MRTDVDSKKINKKWIIIIVVMVILYLACYAGKTIYFEQYGIKPEISKNENGISPE